MVRRRPLWPWLVVLAVPVVSATFWLAGTRARRARLWSGAPIVLSTVPVDRGDLFNEVVEFGTLESANNATVKCQVEALIGMVGGAQEGTGTAQGARGGGSGNQAGQGNTQGGASQGGANAPAAAPAQTKKGAAGKTQAGRGGATKSAGTAKSATSGASGASAGSAATGAGGGMSGSSGSGGSSSGSGGMSGGGGTGTMKAGTKPSIRSFSYVVAPHVSQSSRQGTAGQMQSQMSMSGAMGGGGRGGSGGSGGRGGSGGSGGRGGGGGGRGGSGDMQEKPGSTRIISIRPEGTFVKAGDVVCELDSAAFKDELQAQQIREAQARVLVEQAEAILEVNEITLREFRDGIYPQDAQLIRQYISTCKIQEEQARRNVEWSREAHRKHYRATAQLNADILSLQQTEIALREAQGMTVRLEKYTAPRVLKALEANIAAIRADKFARESTYGLERDRVKKLEQMIAYCTLKAPRDGIVVYAKDSNGWGNTMNQIEQGVTVRQGQAIFHLPDPKNMLVKTRINESKVAMVRPGQRAEILIDAFPDRPLRGTVREVTAIPSPVNGPFSDVRVYFATVGIDSGGFEEIRPGLSAQVSFEVAARHQVTRVPLQAIRRVGGATFAAVRTADDSPWVWRRVSIGLLDPIYAEVVDGLKPGDHVVERPEALPAPQQVPIIANSGRAARG